MKKLGFAVLLILAGGMALAQQKKWSAAVPLSTGGEGWEASVAVDANGAAVAVWDERTITNTIEDHIWSRTRSAAGAWSATTVISPATPSLSTTATYPKVRMSTSGDITATWFDSTGLWTADRPKGQSWSGPRLLLPNVSSGSFLMNSTGDSAIVWGVGRPQVNGATVYAIRRAAGGSWRAQETVATGTHIALDSAALSDNGDLLVAWEAYTAVCTRRCRLSNYLLNVSREAASSNAWTVSGSLAGPDSGTHYGLTAISPGGTAVLLYRNSNLAWVAVTQATTGAAWSAPVQVLSASSAGYLAGAVSDATGVVTAAFQSGGTPAAVLTVTGDLSSNTWSAPVFISGNDQSPNSVILAGSSTGGAVLLWAAGDPSLAATMIRVSFRPATMGAWSVPQTISPAGATLAAPEAADVNANGQAIAVFSAYDASTSMHTEYASSN